MFVGNVLAGLEDRKNLTRRAVVATLAFLCVLGIMKIYEAVCGLINPAFSVSPYVYVFILGLLRPE